MPTAREDERGLRSLKKTGIAYDDSATVANSNFVGDNGISGIQLSVNNVYCPTYVVKAVGDKIKHQTIASGSADASANLSDAGTVDCFRSSDEFLQQTRKALNTDNDVRCTDILDCHELTCTVPTDVAGAPENGPGSIYARDRFLFTYTFEHAPTYDEQSSRWISGLNTAGNAATMQLMTEGTGSCGGGDYFDRLTDSSGNVAVNQSKNKGHVQMIFCEMTSVMRVSANKMIEVVQ